MTIRSPTSGGELEALADRGRRCRAGRRRSRSRGCASCRARRRSRRSARHRVRVAARRARGCSRNEVESRQRRSTATSNSAGRTGAGGVEPLGGLRQRRRAGRAPCRPRAALRSRPRVSLHERSLGNLWRRSDARSMARAGEKSGDLYPVRTDRTTVRVGSVGLAMPVVWSDRHRLARARRRGLGRGADARAPRCPSAPSGSARRSRRPGARFVEAEPHPDERCSPSTTAALLDYLAARLGATGRPRGLPATRARTASSPTSSPTPGLLGGLEPRGSGGGRRARAGRFAYDTMTLIGPGTWEAARAAPSTSRSPPPTSSSPASPPPTPAAGRPGHHATRAAFGGSCYLNNAAAAAARLRRGARRPGRGDRHRRPPRQRHPVDLLRRPRGADRLGPRRPGRRLVPPLPRLRRRGRRGRRRGRQPQPAAGARLRRRALARGGRRARRLGARGRRPRRWSSRSASTRRRATPRARSQVTADGYRAAGRLLGELGLPTVVVQEGGYDLETIGALVLATLRGVSTNVP